MGSSSKSVLIMGAVIIAILVMAVGMFVFNSAQSTISSSDTINYGDSLKDTDIEDEDEYEDAEDDAEDEESDVLFGDDMMSSFTKQEIEAFNNNFLSYGGKQTGSNIKALITRLIANVKTYKNELEKIPYVCYSNENGSNTLVKPEKDNSNQQNYIDDLTVIKNKLENKHTYYVEFTYQESGLIDYIHIFYNETEDANLLNR